MHLHTHITETFSGDLLNVSQGSLLILGVPLIAHTVLEYLFYPLGLAGGVIMIYS